MNRFLLLFLFMSILNMSYAQKKVTGRVISGEDNLPVIGAVVKIDGYSEKGTFTDEFGIFSLVVPDSADKITVTYVGMETQTLPVKAAMQIIMQPTDKMLGEVVVMGMTNVDKRLFTGATNRLAADDIKLDGLPEISRSLEGRAAGVSVQNVSGTFGTAPKIRVRGATSIYGSSRPLWIVDGIAMEDVIEVNADDLSSGDAVTLISSAVAGLNADDIESFQILKDGSATSIYGARAMNGVIVVTTKKGKAGVNRISYTGEYTVRLKPSYSDFNIMNSQEQMGVYKEMEAKGWLNFNDVYSRSESGVYGHMYRLINTYDPVTGQFALMNTPEAKNAYLREAEMRNTNWFGELFETNVMQSHSVGITSGTDKSSYYASLSALIDPGWSKQSKVNRYTANLNTTYNVLPNLSLAMIAGATYRSQKAPGTLSQEVDPFYGEVKRDFDINPYSYALNASRTMDANTFYRRNYADFNILHELENNYMDLSVADLKYQAELKWKVIPELELKVLGAIKYNASSQEHKIKDSSNQAMAYRAMDDATIRDRNPYLYINPDISHILAKSILPEGGIYQRTDYKMLGYDFRASFDLKKVFNKDHITQFFGGTEINSVDRNQSWFQGWGLQYETGEIPFYIYEYFKKGIETNTQYYSISSTRARNAAFFGMGSYSYQGKYVLTMTGRYDGSNRVGKTTSSRWLPTWNIAGGWNVHEEEFFDLMPASISHLSLRASYSLTGDRGLEAVSNSQAVIKPFRPFRPFESQQEHGLEIYDVENSELTYEKKYELNLGFDIGLLGKRLNISADWFRRNNYDLIGPVATQGVGGFVQKLANIASMKSGGFDFTVSSKNLILSDFTWNTDFVFGHVTTEVTEFDSQARIIDLISGTGFTMKGYPYRGLFSIPFKGLNKDGIPTFLNHNGEITVDNIDFQDRDNVGYLKYEGPTDPTYTGSLGNMFSYKNFRLNLFMTYGFGNKVRLDPFFKSEYSDLSSMPKEFRNRWIFPNDEKITNVPVIASTRQTQEYNYIALAYNAYNYSDVRVAKGDFIRMKEISLIYDFPKLWLNKNINNLSLKFQATNLFLIYSDSKLNGQDPEFFRSGGVAVPVPKQFTMTLRLGL